MTRDELAKRVADVFAEYYADKPERREMVRYLAVVERRVDNQTGEVLVVQGDELPPPGG